MNKKLTKLLSIFLIAGAVGAGAAGIAGCKNTHEHDFAYEDAGNGTHHVTCKGCDEVFDDHGHVYDDDEDTTCNLCGYTSGLGGVVVGNAIIPEYKGPAAGPEAGEQKFTSSFVADDLPKGALTEAYTNGVVTIPSGTNFRDQAALSGEYTNSVQNGTITIKVPVAGKLTIYYSSGSGTVGNAGYKLQKPDNTSETATINAAAKVLQTLEIDAVPGTYVFSKDKGTVNTYAIVLEYSSESKPITGIEISNAGTTDYLVTQKLDCTTLELIAKDAGGATYPVNLENCTFETSAYNPNASGEYTISVTYHLSDNLDSATKEFTATYKVKVYMVDSIELSTIGLASNKQVTVQQVYLPGDTFKTDYLSIIATCGFGGSNIQQKLKSEWVTVSTPTLTAEGTQTVTVSVDSKYTTNNKSVSTTYEVVVKAKKEVTDNKVEVTVGETGEFATLTQAVQYLKACSYGSSVNKVIKLQAGTYTEKVWIDIDNVTLIGLGEDVDDTAISYSLVEGDADKLSNTLWGLNCATVHVTGNNFKAYNLAIRNDFDYIANNKKYSGSQAAQGVALTLEGDGNVIYKCHLFGNQDTLYMKKGRTYFKESQIDGNIDFIFGGETGLAYFEECKIVAIDRENAKKGASATQNGYITAPQHKEATKPDYGYIFYKCEVTDDGKVNAGGMALGRPWGPNATVAYIECSFSAAYSKVAYGTSDYKTYRWCDMSGAKPENADYKEYGSTGEGAITTAVKGGSVIDADAAANYTKANIFGTSNGKQSYATAFDCDGEYAKLRILAGLDTGEIPENPVKTYDLLGYTGGNSGELQSSTDDYEVDGITIKIDATKGKFAVRTQGDVQINSGTIIYVPMAADYEVSITDYQNNKLGATYYSIDYVDLADVHYVKITFVANCYIKSITVNTEKTVTMYSVSFDLNGATGTAPATQKVASGGKLLPVTEPAWAEHTFDGWYTEAEGGEKVDLSSYEVTAGATLYAHWTEGAITEISETTTITFGVNGDYKSYESRGLADYHNGVARDNNDTSVQLQNTATFTIKAVPGATVTIEWYDANDPQYGDDSCATVTVAEDGTITIEFAVGATGGSSGLYIKSITITIA
ncbi:MAG: InlB B-repeat-containing protein [Clostridia bacterium]|nr:InlB B-repeat-containing protein [Clostridia bacterium]